jgi:hypothetical protein
MCTSDDEAPPSRSPGRACALDCCNWEVGGSSYSSIWQRTICGPAPPPPLLAPNGPPAMSAVRSLSGVNRTWGGQPYSVEIDPYTSRPRSSSPLTWALANGPRSSATKMTAPRPAHPPLRHRGALNTASSLGPAGLIRLHSTDQFRLIRPEPQRPEPEPIDTLEAVGPSA